MKLIPIVQAGGLKKALALAGLGTGVTVIYKSAHNPSNPPEHHTTTTTPSQDDHRFLESVQSTAHNMATVARSIKHAWENRHNLHHHDHSLDKEQLDHHQVESFSNEFLASVLADLALKTDNSSLQASSLRQMLSQSWIIHHVLSVAASAPPTSQLFIDSAFFLTTALHHADSAALLLSHPGGASCVVDIAAGSPQVHTAALHALNRLNSISFSLPAAIAPCNDDLLKVERDATLLKQSPSQRLLALRFLKVWAAASPHACQHLAEMGVGQRLGQVAGSCISSDEGDAKVEVAQLMSLLAAKTPASRLRSLQMESWLFPLVCFAADAAGEGNWSGVCQSLNGITCCVRRGVELPRQLMNRSLLPLLHRLAEKTAVVMVAVPPPPPKSTTATTKSTTTTSISSIKKSATISKGKGKGFAAATGDKYDVRAAVCSAVAALSEGSGVKFPDEERMAWGEVLLQWLTENNNNINRDNSDASDDDDDDDDDDDEKVAMVVAAATAQTACVDALTALSHPPGVVGLQVAHAWLAEMINYLSREVERAQALANKRNAAAAATAAQRSSSSSSSDAAAGYGNWLRPSYWWTPTTTNPDSTSATTDSSSTNHVVVENGHHSNQDAAAAAFTAHVHANMTSRSATEADQLPMIIRNTTTNDNNEKTEEPSSAEPIVAEEAAALLNISKEEELLLSSSTSGSTKAWWGWSQSPTAVLSAWWYDENSKNSTTNSSNGDDDGFISAIDADAAVDGGGGGGGGGGESLISTTSPSTTTTTITTPTTTNDPGRLRSDSELALYINAAPVGPSYARCVAMELLEASGRVGHYTEPPADAEESLSPAAIAAYSAVAAAVDVEVADRALTQALKVLNAMAAGDAERRQWLVNAGLFKLLKRVALHRESDEIEAIYAAAAAAAAAALSTSENNGSSSSTASKKKYGEGATAAAAVVAQEREPTSTLLPLPLPKLPPKLAAHSTAATPQLSLRQAIRLIALISVDTPGAAAVDAEPGLLPYLHTIVSMNDCKISSCAAKALLNVTSASNNNNTKNHERVVLHDGIQLFDPEASHHEDLALHGAASSSSEAPLLDVVFVHGIRGGAFATWRREGVLEHGAAADSLEQAACWPSSWLGPLLGPRVRLLSAEYAAPATAWEGESLPFHHTAEQIAGKLAAAGVGRRPVVFITHSMGGLVVKEILARGRMSSASHATATGTEAQKQLCSAVAGVVFYSVPHAGSRLADWGWTLRYVGASPAKAVAQLTTGPHLEALNNAVRGLARAGLPVLSFSEGLPTQLSYVKAHIVPHESAYPGYGEFVVLKDHDHVSACKPRDKEDPAFAVLVKFLKESVLKNAAVNE